LKPRSARGAAFLFADGCVGAEFRSIAERDADFIRSASCGAVAHATGSQDTIAVRPNLNNGRKYHGLGIQNAHSQRGNIQTLRARMNNSAATIP